MRLLVLLLALCLGGVQTARADPRVPNRAIRVAGDNQFPPFEYVDASGQYRGFNVEFMQALATELSVDVEFVPLPWQEAVKALQEGRVDAIQGMKVTPERQREYLFTESYLTTSHALFVLVDNQYIHGLNDLAGARVVVQAGDYGHELLRGRPEVRLETVENQAQGVDLLVGGSVDAFLGNRLTALSSAQRRGLTEKIKQVGGPINPATYAVATRKDNAWVVDLLDPGIQTLKHNGTHAKIFQKWFGERLLGAAPRLRWLALAAVALALAGVGVSLLTYRWNLALKREVHRRTADLDREHRLNQQILSSAPVSMVTIDTGGIIVSANALAVGLAGQELVGRAFRGTLLAGFVAPDHLASALRLGVGYTEVERTVGDGDEAHTYRYSLAPLLPQGGAVLILGDVTEEVQMKGQLKHHAKMEMVGRMVAGLAHEIRNPLTSLKAFVQLLPAKYDNASFRQELLAHVPREIDRVDSLVSDLLDYSRPRARQRDRLDAADVLASVAALIRAQAARQQTSIAVQVAQGTCFEADPHQVRQILLNLVLNSLQAVGQGGAVTLHGYRDGDRAVLEVRDTGPGIAPEDLDRIFEPFFTRRTGGTGLGLWISYQYTRENGGEISLSSPPGQGTRVRVSFPACREG